MDLSKANKVIYSKKVFLGKFHPDRERKDDENDAAWEAYLESIDKNEFVCFKEMGVEDDNTGALTAEQADSIASRLEPEDAVKFYQRYNCDGSAMLARRRKQIADCIIDSSFMKDGRPATGQEIVDHIYATNQAEFVYLVEEWAAGVAGFQKPKRGRSRK